MHVFLNQILLLIPGPFVPSHLFTITLIAGVRSRAYHFNAMNLFRSYLAVVLAPDIGKNITGLRGLSLVYIPLSSTHPSMRRITYAYTSYQSTHIKDATRIEQRGRED
jgi:hypothetical protein